MLTCIFFSLFLIKTSFANFSNPLYIMYSWFTILCDSASGVRLGFFAKRCSTTRFHRGRLRKRGGRTTRLGRGAMRFCSVGCDLARSGCNATVPPGATRFGSVGVQCDLARSEAKQSGSIGVGCAVGSAGNFGWGMILRYQPEKCLKM